MKVLGFFFNVHGLVSQYKSSGNYHTLLSMFVRLRGGSPGQAMLQQQQLNNNYWGPSSPPEQPVYTSNSVIIGPEAAASVSSSVTMLHSIITLHLILK